MASTLNVRSSFSILLKIHQFTQCSYLQKKYRSQSTFNGVDFDLRSIAWRRFSQASALSDISFRKPQRALLSLSLSCLRASKSQRPRRENETKRAHPNQPSPARSGKNLSLTHAPTDGGERDGSTYRLVHVAAAAAISEFWTQLASSVT